MINTEARTSTLRRTQLEKEVHSLGVQRISQSEPLFSVLAVEELVDFVFRRILISLRTRQELSAERSEPAVSPLVMVIILFRCDPGPSWRHLGYLGRCSGAGG